MPFACGADGVRDGVGGQRGDLDRLADGVKRSPESERGVDVFDVLESLEFFGWEQCSRTHPTSRDRHGLTGTPDFSRETAQLAACMLDRS